MTNLFQNAPGPEPGDVCRERAALHRVRPLTVLFVHHDSAVIQRCLHEFENRQFIVKSDVVAKWEDCVEQLRRESYEVVVLEYPEAFGDVSDVPQLLRQTLEQVPVLFLTSGTGKESMGELAAQGIFDSVELEQVAKLPMAVRRALKEKKLREELDEARKALQHSQSLYRALVDNPAYGICRCNLEGKLLEANQALVTMLGYASKEQLLSANQVSALIPALQTGFSFTGSSGEANPLQPLEVEWKRKDGTTLKVTLSGRGYHDEKENFVGYEIIAVDVTEQRTLEDELRQQASSDSLTGLANHRRLVEVLHAEIYRSKRTEREFSLVLLDLDGLKGINDRHGHLVGSRALCRLGQILSDCCRSVDTAARHGGDEFAVVLPETGLAAATSVARRICDLLEKDTEYPALSVSFGVASYSLEADSIAALLHAADRSLYAMKSRKPHVFRAAASASAE
jgi:two-component system, cell cycle response regulator